MRVIIGLLRRYKKTGGFLGALIISVMGFNSYYELSFNDYVLFFGDPSLYWNIEEYDSKILTDSETGGYLFGGVPEMKDGSTFRLIKNSAYWVGYDSSKRSPAWVAYRLERKNDLNTVPRPENFIPDFRTFPPISPKIYTRSGYDRGHMAPNYAISTFYPKHVDSSFLMSNIVPQKPDLNRHVWRKLEMKIAKEYASRYKELWVLMGPIYSKDSEKIRFISIPDAFFKIITVVDDNLQVRMMAFRFPQDVNTTDTLEKYLTNTGLLEQELGINFFPDMSEEWDRIKYMTYKRVW